MRRGACVTKKLPLAVTPKAASQSRSSSSSSGFGREALAGGVDEQVEPAELLDRPRDERPRLLDLEPDRRRRRPAARTLPAVALQPPRRSRSRLAPSRR